MTLRVHPDDIVRDSDSPLLAIHPSWERTRLADVADVLNGFAFKSTSFSKSEGMPLLRIRDVGSSGTEANYVGDFDPHYLVEPGSIVVGMDGDFRVARWAGPVALLNQRVCKISVRDEGLYDLGFLFYALPGYLDAINARTSSVTVKHLSSRTVQEIPLPLPSLAEQRRIVAAIDEQFSRLDASDALLDSASRRTIALRESVLAATCGGEWPARKVGEIASLSDGPFGSNLKTSHYVEAGPRVVRLQNIADGFFRDEPAHITDEHFNRLAKHEVLAGDIVAASLGDNAPRACLVPAWLGPAIVKADCIRIRSRVDVDSSFLMWALNSPPVRAQAATRIKGIGRPRLGLGGIRDLMIPVPPLDEQRRIVAEVEQRLSVIDTMLDTIATVRRRSASLRRSILEQAFTGGLVPPDPSDEPASTLLERIAAERAAEPKSSRRKRKVPA